MSAIESSDLEIVIPPDVHVAAKRAFIRTTAQSYAATLSTSVITVSMIVSMIKDPDWILIGATFLVAILTPFLAGLAAYFNIMSNGIPEAYGGEAVAISVEALEIPYVPRHAHDDSQVLDSNES